MIHKYGKDHFLIAKSYMHPQNWRMFDPLSLYQFCATKYACWDKNCVTIL